MRSYTMPKKPVAWLRLAAAALFVMSVLCPPQALAQVPARFYWKTLSDGNAIPLIVQSISGNANPFDPAAIVTPGTTVDATVALSGYAHTFTLADRSAMAAILLPMGRVSGTVGPSKQSSSGFGDPMLEFNYNLIGPKAQINIPDAMRYQPGFTLDILADLAIPIGEYNSNQALNLGQNRWYGRIASPMIMQLGPWVPGRRTTLELTPSVWMYGNNDNYNGGGTLKTDPMFQLDAHLTRDFTANVWGSLDMSWYTAGKSTINGVAGSKRDDLYFGLTLGYQLNQNLGLTVGYKSTFNDSAPGKMQMDNFMLTLVYGWHPLIEGMNRLKSGH